MAAVHSEGHAAAVPSRFAPEGDATRLLYERHQRKILSFCKHQLGSREEAEDAAQITFLNAFRGIKSGTSPEFESAWLFKIAHNVCLTKQRNSYRRQLIEAPTDFGIIEERVPAHEGDTDELFGLHAALRVIPEQQRRALLLREWQGLTYKEIADEMRLTQAAVETLLFRARRSLADALTTDPAEKRKRGRPKMTSNVGSFVAALKSLLLGGSVKVAATVATVAATSVVSVTPSVRHDVLDAVGQGHTSHLPAVPAPLPSSHLSVSVTPLAHPVTPLAHRVATLKPLATRHGASGPAPQTHIATPVTRLPTVAAEAQPAAPVERSAAAASPAALPGSSGQLPSVPVSVPASAPAPPPVSRDAPPADSEPAAAPTPTVSPSTSPASGQGLTASPAPAPAPSTTTQPPSTKLQRSPIKPEITPVTTTPVVTEATAPTPAVSPTKTTLQVVNVPAPTPVTPTVTTAPTVATAPAVTTTPSTPATPQPAPVQPTATQPAVTPAPVAQTAPAPKWTVSVQITGGNN
jgi:RNA polymerase sigma factor (sigma-70 family)